MSSKTNIEHPSSDSCCDSLFFAANVFTSQGTQNQIIKDAAIVVLKGQIVWLGKKSLLPPQYHVLIDFNHREYNSNISIHHFPNGWLTTGLIDCHTHIIYAGNRSKEFKQRLQGASYTEIAQQGGGILSTVKATREASHDELFKSALKRIQHLASEGVLCLEIKSGYGLELEAERKMLSVARKLAEQTKLDIKATCLAAHALPPEYKEQPNAYIDLVCEQILPTLAKEGLVDAVDGFCENIGFNLKQINKVFSKAQQLDLPVKLHAEQLSNLGGSVLAAEFEALSVDHLEYLEHDAVKAIKTSSTVAVLLPGAFYTLGETQKPPIELLRKHRIPMAIATDSNPGSSPCNSLLLMLNMACTLFQLTADEALMGVTKNAAKALGLGSSHGQIKVGLQADFVHWNIDDIDELCYYFGNNPCNQRFKNGIEFNL